jgi:uncharacterized protein involved in exopolysaccharide biosynthesis
MGGVGGGNAAGAPRSWLFRLLGIGQQRDYSEKLEGLDYFAVLLRHRALVFAIVFVCTMIGFTVGMMSKPRFTATTTAVAAEDESSQSAAAGALSGLSFLTGKTSGSRQDTAIALLSARSTLQQLIVQRNLLPVLFPDKWDAERRSWKQDAAPPSLEDGYDRLKGVIKIEQDTVANVIRVSVTWEDAAIAAAWANGLTTLVNQKMQTVAIERSDRMIAYLYSELGKIENRSVQANIANLIEGQIKARMMAKSNSDYALDVIDPALATKTKSSLGKGILMIAGFMIGFLLSVPLAFFLEALAARRARARP